ncbi:NAD(P)H-dependent oxidoreductase subunit E [Herbaspirillum sp. RTI4]|uniref:NAD(P)H-dependent oxidoreductase subunit E n=1 Tax=Herbaspirillum sp. RTI4 TaxID=3048640 RepID=UPI002AB5BB5C|nr:NAD(P)H-dependent oxidoreductase subunit E [Herbaspirillum sp. RTI4]MDY7577068.1 NAD(P)H-dependent oxidoreductase subunit E [Herbaspirillum sp. RTI4]MEA9982248.1 NAD(P)H-dependent oxidoreductase subunit E [Herbaspirillum sp. RTI4]
MKKINEILDRYHSDRTRLMDILWDVQHQWGYIPDKVLPAMADKLGTTEQDIRETYSFYHFFLGKPAAKHHIYLSDTVIAKMHGYQAVFDALEKETGCVFGAHEEVGPFCLETTSCIGLSDQEPAMLIGKEVFTRLTPEKIARIIHRLKNGETPAEIVNPNGLATDTLAYVHTMVESGIRSKGPLFFQGKTDFKSLLNRVICSPPDVVTKTVSESGLRGRGGAGFSTGLKWRLCSDNEEKTRFVICNADEGEPGTFKDRVLLMESPQEVIFGMITAGYAIGAQEGIIYLRSEYFYLKNYLEKQLAEFRAEGLLGKAIGGKPEFNFEIRIQMGAGAYICGDETALIESLEGNRGTPRVKPPYPVNMGYLGKPTSANNVETFVAVTHIIDKGASWFKAMGTAESAGTRLLSISGDCDAPGIYEIEWGITLNEVLKKAGAKDAWAVQVSGPSGECVSVEKDGDRKIALEDLSCNGSFMIFNRSRDLLGIVRQFTQFFVNESCGICVPCRSGNVDLFKKINRVIDGKACQKDLDEVVVWGKLVRKTSRCGLGGTSPKPILTTLENFPQLYQEKLVKQEGPLLPSFDLKESRRGYLEAISTLSDRSTS